MFYVEREHAILWKTAMCYVQLTRFNPISNKAAN